jgi:mannose-1-phosphate guanylyltransferase
VKPWQAKTTAARSWNKNNNTSGEFVATSPREGNVREIAPKKVAFVVSELDYRQTMGQPGKLREVPKARRYAVVMAGGSGTRFWPWSRRALPKQLLALAGRDSMLRETVDRVRSLVPDENILIVTAERLARAVRKELPFLPATGILAEPAARNTAPCIGWAAEEIVRRDPDGVLLVLASDHVVAPLSRFKTDLKTALALADRERALVTFGIPPTFAATGYGYIRAGKPVASMPAGSRAFETRAFHEKPSAARAKCFLAGGDFYWNSGMFAWRADVILEEIAKHQPKLSRGLTRLYEGRPRGRATRRALSAVYPRLPSISVDHGVMEAADRVLVLPASFEWNDIGSWDAVAALWPDRGNGNRSRDPLLAVESENNVVATGGKPVALLGVSDMAVVDAGDAILVCPRDRAEEVRKIVDALGTAGLKDLS